MSSLYDNLEKILSQKIEKIIPENIKKDVQIFDVTGTLEPGGSTTTGVKLFKTQEEMHADESAKEGDLAVVYRNEIQNMTSSTETQYITFPETVILPEAFTGSAYAMLRAVGDSFFDGNAVLEQNTFRFDGFSEQGMIRVSYTSDDGITYTRTRFSGDSGDLTNPVDLGAVVKCEMPEDWNDMLGYFMQTGGMYFDGLFEYTIGGIKTKLKTILVSNLTFDIPSTTVTWNGEYGGPIFDYDKIAILKTKIDNERPESIITDDVNRRYYFAVGEDNNPYILAIINKDKTNHGPDVNIPPYFDAEGNIIGTAYSLMDTDGYRLWAYKLNLEEGTYEEPVIYEPQGDDGKCYWNFKLKTIAFIPNREYNGRHDWYLTRIDIVYMGTGTSSSTYWTMFNGNLYADGYWYAANQYTLSSPNQLLPNVTAYGKNGNVVGDQSLYNNLSNEYLMEKFFGITSLTEIKGKYAVSSSDLGINAYKKDSSGDIYIVKSLESKNASTLEYLGSDKQYSAYSSDGTKIVAWDMDIGNIYSDKVMIYDASTKEILYRNVYGTDSVYGGSANIVPNKLDTVDKFYYYRHNTKTHVAEIVKVDVNTVTESIIWQKQYSNIGFQLAAIDDGNKFVVGIVQHSSSGEAMYKNLVIVDRTTDEVKVALDEESSNIESCKLGLVFDSSYIYYSTSEETSSGKTETVHKIDVNTAQSLLTKTYTLAETDDYSHICFHKAYGSNLEGITVFSSRSKVWKITDELIGEDINMDNYGLFGQYLTSASFSGEDSNLQVYKIQVKDGQITTELLCNMNFDRIYYMDIPKYAEGCPVTNISIDYVKVIETETSIILHPRFNSMEIHSKYIKTSIFDADMIFITYIANNNEAKLLPIYLDTITSDEYNQALATAKQIEGSVE